MGIYHVPPRTVEVYATQGFLGRVTNKVYLLYLDVMYIFYTLDTMKDSEEQQMRLLIRELPVAYTCTL